MNLLERSLSLLLLFLCWQLLTTFLHSPLLPSPLAVGNVLVEQLQSGELLHHLFATLRRLFLSFALAMLLGSGLGIALGSLPRIDRWLDGWLTLLLNTPMLVVAILCYLWLGLTEEAAVLAVVLNKLPLVAVTLREGTRALDRELLQMARVYRLGLRRTLYHVVLPQLLPFFLTATRTGLALIWKIILVVELLGLGDGIGFQLHLFFQQFDVAAILAYTLAFAAVIQLIEWGVVQPLERRLLRWR